VLLLLLDHLAAGFEPAVCAGSTSRVSPWEAIQDEATLTSSSTLLQPVLQHLQDRHRQTRHDYYQPCKAVCIMMQYGAATTLHSPRCWYAVDASGQHAHKAGPCQQAVCAATWLVSAAAVVLPLLLLCYR
jgi:hypothetical protein